MKQKLYKYLIIIVIIFTILCITIQREKMVSVEELDTPAGIGVDIITGTDNETLISIPISIYNFLGGKKENTSYIRTGTGISIGDTRNTRALISNHKLILGSEKLYVLSEDFVKKYTRIILDSLYRNVEVNDMGYVVVCKGSSLPILEYKMEGYPSSSDYIQGMVENSISQNFFSNNYKLVDIFVRVDSEGRNIVLPYIELKEDGPKITGMALFKGEKMNNKIDMDEGRIMNLLRDNDVTGILGIKDGANKATEIYCKSKRKVTCYKKDGKYTFNINLDITGDIFTNEIYHDMFNKIENKIKFEKDASKQVEMMCNEFIDKMKNEYNVDCLELGRVAASKYGRNLGVDWNEVVCSSDINVKVKITIARYGRGDY